MKILILSMLVLTMTFISNAQNVNIPDANFKNALISAGVDTSGDGEISYYEAEAIKKLDVEGKSISDMTGIEAFVNLDTLNCHENQLTSLDVSDNTGLIILACGSNQLTNLDVSGCKALTGLFCFDNQLTSLDVSGCTALKYLVCFFNQLTYLDVSGSIALTQLDCHDNQLTSLDVSGCIALAELICFWNLLTNLDVSNNTAVTVLDCSVNQLTSLDISNNTNLLNLNLSFMPTLYEVCVWEMPFPPDDKVDLVDTTGSPNVYFTTDCSVSNLNANEENGYIDIYPNPSDNILNIEIENPDNATLEIYNVNGKLIFSKALNSKFEKIDISGLSRGLYMVKVEQDSAVSVGKVVVR